VNRLVPPFPAVDDASRQAQGRSALHSGRQQALQDMVIDGRKMLANIALQNKALPPHALFRAP
jgi:hypothetical protein